MVFVGVTGDEGVVWCLALRGVYVVVTDDEGVMWCLCWCDW